MLQIRGLCIAYPIGDGLLQPVIRDLELELQPGQMALVKAPSGGGKTSILNAISGIIPQVIKAELRGSISLFESDPLKSDGIDLQLVELPQMLQYLSYQMAETYFFFPQVEQELAFSLENLGKERQVMQEQIVRVAEYFGLKNKLRMDAGKLSAGEARLLSWALCELIDAPLVLLDEPCRGVSEKNLPLLQDWLGSLLERGKTVLCTEHSSALDCIANCIIRL